jgi:hypothetical protein
VVLVVGDSKDNLPAIEEPILQVSAFSFPVTLD